MSVRLLVATLSLAAVGAMLTPVGAHAQGRGRNDAGVPPGQRPASGLCRVWHEGVAPGRQPPPVSCEEARRTAPRDARIIYGDDRNQRDDDRRRTDARRDTDRRDDDRRNLPRGQTDRGPINLPRGQADRGPNNLPRNSARCDDTRWRNGNCEWDDDVRCRESGRNVVCDRASSSMRNRGPLPAMPTTNELRRNRIDRETARWLGTTRAESRFTDRNRDGRPERVEWTDTRGRPMQTWFDLNGNGRVDRVILHR